MNIPIIALSQLSRDAVKRQGSNSMPQLSDLRESGSIEQDADMVLFIHRYDYQGLNEDPADAGRTELIIAKHRNGEIGNIPLMFRSSEVRFVDEAESLPFQANVSVASLINGDDRFPDPFDGISSNSDFTNTEF